MNALSPELEPIEVDARPCGNCGLAIDRHRMVDDGDGPIFFCVDTFEATPHNPGECVCGHGIEVHIGIDYFCPVAEPLEDINELERRAELRRQEEVAAIFARLEAMDDPSKRLPARAAPEPYRPAASTVAAFLYLVGLDDL